MAPPAPDAVRPCGVFDGFLALPNSPIAVELGFMFGGSDTDRSEGIRLGVSAAPGSAEADSLNEPNSEEPSLCPGDVGVSRSFDRSISSGVAGIESEPLIAGSEGDEAAKQLCRADGAAASTGKFWRKPCKVLNVRCRAG